MTLLNVAIGRTEAAILVDTLAPGYGTNSQKIYAHVPSGLLLARTGDPGHLLVTNAFRRMLELGLLPGEPIELSLRAPQVLRDLYAEHMAAGGNMALVAAGLSDGEAYAWRFDSDRGFEPVLYATGTCWVQPAAVPVAAVPPGSAVALNDGPSVPQREAPFADQLAEIIVAAEWQAREFPDKVGGTAVLARIDADGIRLVSLFDFAAHSSREAGLFGSYPSTEPTPKACGHALQWRGGPESHESASRSNDAGMPVHSAGRPSTPHGSTGLFHNQPQEVR